MHPPRAVAGDDNSLGKYAAGLAVVPLRVEQIDIHGEHHPGLELVADRFERAFVGAQRMVAIARILQRGEAVAMDAGLADTEARAGDLVAHRVHCDGDFRTRPEQREPAPVCGKARLVDVEVAWLRLAQAERALDMGEIAAEFRMHLA